MIFVGVPYSVERWQTCSFISNRIPALADIEVIQVAATVSYHFGRLAQYHDIFLGNCKIGYCRSESVGSVFCSLRRDVLPAGSLTDPAAGG